MFKILSFLRLIITAKALEPTNAEIFEKNKKSPKMSWFLGHRKLGRGLQNWITWFFTTGHNIQTSKKIYYPTFCLHNNKKNNVKIFFLKKLLATTQYYFYNIELINFIWHCCSLSRYVIIVYYKIIVINIYPHKLVNYFCII